MDKKKLVIGFSGELWLWISSLMYRTCDEIHCSSEAAMPSTMAANLVLLSQFPNCPVSSNASLVGVLRPLPNFLVLCGSDLGAHCLISITAAGLNIGVLEHNPGSWNIKLV